MGKILNGKGGHGKSAPVTSDNTGYRGKGVMKFKTVAPSKDTYGGQRPPMARPTMGRVLNVGKGRKGVPESS